jgi:hypothetical protein
MMKIGKSKTHHKLYVTERELEVLAGEGALSFTDDVHDIDRAALERVYQGFCTAAGAVAGEGAC